MLSAASAISQTVDIGYLNPTLGSETPYKFIRFGTADLHYAGFMWNNNHASFGNGDDFSIFTYGNRDITIRPGTGNFIIFPASGGKVGIGTSSPDSKLTVKGFWDNLIHFGDPANDDAGRIYSTYESSSAYLNFIEYDEPFVFNFLQTATGESIKMGFHKGNVGIGTTTPDSRLAVNGIIRAKEVKVEATNWPDYVFGKGYQLMPLDELESYITENGHLPNIPTEAAIKQDGLKLAEMNAKLLEKVEELTLYLIALKKENELINRRIEQLESK